MLGKARAQLIRARSLRGLTQEQLAKRLSVEPSTVARWEQGRRSAANRNRVALAEFFDVPIEIVELWFGLGSPPGGVNPAIIVHAAYREAMRSAGLSHSKIAEIRAHADLFIKGFEVAQDPSRPRPDPDR